MTYSSPSLRAVVWMFAESDPVPGSVIAIAAQVPSNFSSCSSLATEAIAELPSPWRGIESSRPTSPQHISMMESTDARLAPFLFPCFSSGFSLRRTPAAPAPPVAPDSEMPSIIAASMSSSLGYSCSASSYLREIGRSMFIATWWAWSISGRIFLGVSRLIMVWSSSDEDRSFHQADGSQVAVPPLHRVFLDEAVSAEQLYAVQADLHAALGTEPASQGDLALGGLALRDASGGLPGHQPHALQLDGDVRDHERHRLAVGDRLAERLALLDVGGDVVEHGLRRTDGQCTPGQAGEAHAVQVVVGVAEQRDLLDGHVLEDEARQAGGAQSHRRVGLDGDAVGLGLHEEELRLAVELCTHDEQLGVGATHHSGLHPVEHEAVALGLSRGGRTGRVEQRSRLGEGERGGRYLVAGERRQVRRLLLVAPPEGQRGGHGTGSQERHGQAHVSLRQRLVDQGARD